MVGAMSSTPTKKPYSENKARLGLLDFRGDEEIHPS